MVVILVSIVLGALVGLFGSQLANTRGGGRAVDIALGVTGALLSTPGRTGLDAQGLFVAAFGAVVLVTLGAVVRRLVNGHAFRT